MALDHHLDLTLRTDPEFPPAVLMSALFGRLHTALAARGDAAQRSDPIAAAFPGWSLAGSARQDGGRNAPATLGRVLRLLGSAAVLDALMGRPWLGPMQGHVVVGPLAAVPEGARPCMLRRVQAKSGVERMRRRRMRRHGIDEAEAARQIPDRCAERLHLPYVKLRSGSTGQPFALFLRLSDEPAGQARAGVFNAYGLSSEATVPRF